MDPLSSVLSLLKPRSYMAGGLDLGAPWSLEFGRHEGVKFHAIVSGRCWVAVEGLGEPVLASAGDCILLPSGRPFRMASDLSLPSVGALSVIPFPLNGAMATINGGGDCLGLGGHFALSGDADILLGLLPPVVHLSKESDRAAMRWSLNRMMEELREPRPGSALIAQHMVGMMLVQILRLYLEDQAGTVGWLSALADKQIAAAMGCIHGEPARNWTLQLLAERAGMSRSIFAMRFKEVVGMSPIDYLIRWRMRLAADRLTHSRDSISEIAASVGYGSESSFGLAFKRVMGCSPRQYGRKGAGVEGAEAG
ncbi:AraC family transcriptional regulator [Geothrix mesophila]|uniref:AraC family transcriptional regulator n=1 Tax=Geothrix mesophila TaxID=2922723 RepID=UPI001FAC5118|nr:AraC family transcriptional regulator [Geothrix sp. SG198]